MKFPSFFLICLLFSLHHLVRSYDVTAYGKVVCHGQGVPYTEISLMDEDWPVDKKMGATTTDSTGHFRVSGSASDIGFGNARRPDVLIRMEYRRYSTSARFQVKPPTLRKKDRSPVLKNRKGNVNFGNIELNTEECLSYLRFYDATNDFFNRVGYRVPFDLTIRTAYLVHGGTPYSAYRTIHLPNNPEMVLSAETAEHELAHTVRHHYDGSLIHFLRDVMKYKYTQNHSCSSKTNKGFAFNEGWAEYWENDCQSGTLTGDQDIEQNVATALTHLQSKCSTSNRGMWEVLRKHAGKIHSLSEFKHYHKQLYNCS